MRVDYFDLYIMNGDKNEESYHGFCTADVYLSGHAC